MSNAEAASTAEPGGDKFDVEFSRLFGEWLATENTSLVLSMAQPDGLLFIGRGPQGFPVTHWTPLPQVGAVAAGADGTLWAAQGNWLWKYENVTRTAGLRAGDTEVYVPRLRILTAALEVADLAVDGFNKCLMASQAYSLVGRASYEVSLEPVWQPDFVTKVADDNRCGLSGIALYDTPRHCATVWSATDRPEGWRENYLQGGSVVVMQDGRRLAEGLCLPLAPRWNPSGLYLLNLGTAEFGRVDLESRSFQPLCACPAYPTGLLLHGSWAVISISAEPPPVVGDLEMPARDRFRQQGIEPFSGILLVDLRTGDIAHNARLVKTGVRASGVAAVDGCQQAAAMTPDDKRLDAMVTFRLASQGGQGPT